MATSVTIDRDGALVATSATREPAAPPGAGAGVGDQRPALPAPVADPGRWAPRAGVLAWAAVVAAALLWGTFAVDRAAVSLRAAPLMGAWGWRWDGWEVAGIVPAAGVGAAAVVWGPRLATRMRWRGLVAGTAATATAWTVALAASDGWYRLTSPLTTRHEYEPVAAGIGGGLGDLGDFLSGYVAGLPDQPIHVQGHPPGPVVLAWLADRAGLGGAGWLAALVVAGWGVAVAAALVAARAVAGERAARRAAPALAVLPAAVWAGTSFDALFAAVAAVGVAGAVLAFVRRSDAWALASGGVLGLALLCSYGAAMALVILAVTVPMLAGGRPSWRLARWAGAVAVGAVAVLVAVRAAGFWWFDGLAATRAAYWDGVGADRPAWYLTLAGNPAALALAVGPAVAAGLAVAARSVLRSWAPKPAPDGRGAGHLEEQASERRGNRDERTPERITPTTGVQTLRKPQRTNARSATAAAVLPAAAVLAVLAADVSQLSRGEVERIWLPLVPWLALAAPGHRRAWLAAQVAVALALQLCLRSPW